MGDIKLGYNTGYWSAGPPTGALEGVKEAERLGFNSVWTAEAYGSDALTPLASGQVRYLTQHVAGGFTGVYFGMYATGNGEPCRAPADFDWFDYEPSTFCFTLK